MAETLNQRIRDLRKAKGLTQLELADQLNITDKAVSKWEANDGNPDISLLPKLASIFGVTIDYLLTGNEPEMLSLDDMDSTKRLSLIIKKDDLELFKKYEYDKDEYIFEKHFRNDATSKLNDKLFKEVCANKANKIFKFLIAHVLEKCKYFNSYYVYDFINEFVIRCIDLDLVEALSCIKLNRFDLSDEPSKFPYEILRRRYTNYDYFFHTDLHLFITFSTFEYFFKNKEKAPKCYEYITSIPFTERDDYYCRDIEIVTYLTEYVLLYALKFKDYKTIDNIMSIFLEKSKSACRESYFAKHLIRGYLCSGNEYYIEGRYLLLSKELIDEAIVLKDPYVEKFIEYNKKIKEILICNNSNNKSTFDFVYIPNETTKKEVLIKADKSISKEDKIKALINNDVVLDISLLNDLLDLSLTQEMLDYCKNLLMTKPITNFELVDEYYKNKKWPLLFQFLVDYDFDYLISMAANNKFDEVYSRLQGPLWEYYKKNYSGYKPHVFDINEKYIDYKFTPRYMKVGSEEWNNALHNFINETKEKWINKNQARLDTYNLNNKMNSISDVITRDYINEELNKGNVEIVIIKLCTKLEALLSKKYNREDDLFNLLNEYCEKDLHWVQDDGWGYDEYCSDDEQIDLLNKLRMNRNNITHPQKDLEPLTADELKKCVEYIFKLEGK